MIKLYFHQLWWCCVPTIQPATIWPCSAIQSN